MASPDEMVRTMAGMFLVRGGRQALPLVEAAIRRGQSMEMAIRVLGDIGTAEHVRLLESLTDHPDPTIRDAARDALRVLIARRTMPVTHR